MDDLTRRAVATFEAKRGTILFRTILRALAKYAATEAAARENEVAGVIVNLFGVINGVQAFLPRMLDQKTPGMVVNVGSKQGITNPPGHPIYNIAKSAVKTFTEARPDRPGRSNASIARDFLDLSFRLESGRVLPVFTRFEGPVTVRVTGPAPASLSPDLDRLLGRAPDPRVEWSPPRHFAQTIELLGEIGQTVALVFPARRLMVTLCGFLRGLGGGAQHLQWTLRHRDGQPATRFGQGLLDPSRDPDHMLEVFRERIERLLLPAPVVAIGLRVDDWQAFEERSLALLDETPGPCDHALLERLSNRLGEQRVRGLRCLPDHRPERAWRLCRPGEGHDGRDVPSRYGLSQPPWLLASPRPLRDHDGVPQYGGALRLETLPERIEAGWWDGFDVTRDYFIAHSPAGAPADTVPAGPLQGLIRAGS